VRISISHAEKHPAQGLLKKAQGDDSGPVDQVDFDQKQAQWPGDCLRTAY
jgi:hypothetical protein